MNDIALPETPAAAARQTPQFDKCPTGIAGLDDITDGGLPRGRPTLVCGAAGSGKTLLAMEFIVRGAAEKGEPGIFVSFEETAPELAKNVASLGFDLAGLQAGKKLLVEHIHIERAEIEETGEYDLEGLFVRLAYAIDSIGAKRIVLDTLEALFSGFNESLLRAELRRLFYWLKERGVTAVITGESANGRITRHGLEEYVADCVIALDVRIAEQVATRRLRVVKYRGSAHGADEYPFLIGARGFSVIPLSALGLKATASEERISSGIKRLDAMLAGKGYYRGSSILVSGTAGTGKSSLAASFAAAACARGERCLYFAFEESPSQIIRNMRSIGLDLEPFAESGLLRFRAERSTAHGLETHLALIHASVEEFDPQVVIVDPISDLGAVGSTKEVKSMLSRMVDFLKMRQATAFFTDLTHGKGLESSESHISSLIDTWILMRDIESGGERNRGMYILKSRGMAHSNQIREFLLSGEGIDLLDVYVGPGGVLTGTARLSQEALDRAQKLAAHQEMAQLQRDLERKRQALEAQIYAMRAGFDAEAAEGEKAIARLQARETRIAEDRADMAKLRKSD